MKKRRIVALLLALAMICGVFAACGKKEEPAPAAPQKDEEKQEEVKEEVKDVKDYTIEDWYALAEQLHNDGKDKYKLLYMPSWAASEYFVNSYDVWKKQFSDFGWELDFIGPKEYTAESQLSVLEAALVSNEYDGIILYPITPEVFSATKDDFWEQYHVPVFGWGFPIDSNCGQYYMSPGNNQELNGECMGKAVIKYVDDNMDYFSKYEGTDGIPVYVCMQSTNPMQNVRVEKAMNMCKEDGRFNIIFVDEQVGEGDADAKAETWIMNYGAETEICIMYNDPITIHYLNMMEQSSTKFSDHIAFITHDGTKAVAKLLQEQGDACRVKGDVVYSHSKVGSLLMEAFQAAIPASKEGLLVDGLTEKVSAEFLDDSYLGPVRIAFNADNVWEVFPDKL